MAIADKITNKNHAEGIKTVSDRSPVYAKKLNDLIDDLTDGTSTDLSVGTLSVDTINETTAANGVTIDGVVLKDSTVLAKVPSETVTATNVLTAAESGKVCFLSSATEFVSTLPAPEAGLYFKFIIAAAPSGAAYTVVTDSSDNVIEGTVVVNGASVAGANEDTITFADGVALVGDWVEVTSDGTSWFVNGVGQAAASITLTQAS